MIIANNGRYNIDCTYVLPILFGIGIDSYPYKKEFIVWVVYLMMEGIGLAVQCYIYEG